MINGFARRTGTQKANTDVFDLLCSCCQNEMLVDVQVAWGTAVPHPHLFLTFLWRYFGIRTRMKQLMKRQQRRHLEQPRLSDSRFPKNTLCARTRCSLLHTASTIPGRGWGLCIDVGLTEANAVAKVVAPSFHAVYPHSSRLCIVTNKMSFSARMCLQRLPH